MMVSRSLRPKSALDWLAIAAAWTALSALVMSTAAPPAHAQTQVIEPRLKANPIPSGAQITLGDIFENAGAAAATPLARAPVAGQRVVFGAPSLQARANAAGLRWMNREGVRDVIVYGVGTPLRQPASARSETASATDTAPTTLAVLARAIPRGEAISAQDVVWMDAPANAPRDALSDPEALIGKTARRALLPNQALRIADVMDTPAVRRGESVTLLFEAGGLRLSLRGRAMADAPIGATIKVVNIQSNKTLDAIVEGQGVARVMASPAAGRVVVQLGRN
jgi:flagellar basal body P-ring formation protein FlgA